MYINQRFNTLNASIFVLTHFWEMSRRNTNLANMFCLFATILDIVLILKGFSNIYAEIKNEIYNITIIFPDIRELNSKYAEFSNTIAKIY